MNKLTKEESKEQEMLNIYKRLYIVEKYCINLETSFKQLSDDFLTLNNKFKYLKNEQKKYNN